MPTPMMVAAKWIAAFAEAATNRHPFDLTSSYPWQHCIEYPAAEVIYMFFFVFVYTNMNNAARWTEYTCISQNNWRCGKRSICCCCCRLLLKGEERVNVKDCKEIQRATHNTACNTTIHFSRFPRKLKKNTFATYIILFFLFFFWERELISFQYAVSLLNEFTRGKIRWASNRTAYSHRIK